MFFKDGHFLCTGNFGIKLGYMLSNDIEMVIVKKNDQVKERKWEDPKNPEQAGDRRDQEQLLRQYKEAKRRNSNLTGNNRT